VAEQKLGEAVQSSLPLPQSDEELQEQAEREWSRPLPEQARKAVNVVNMFSGARLTAREYGVLTRLIGLGAGTVP